MQSKQTHGLLSSEPSDVIAHTSLPTEHNENGKQDLLEQRLTPGHLAAETHTMQSAEYLLLQVSRNISQSSNARKIKPQRPTQSAGHARSVSAAASWHLARGPPSSSYQALATAWCA